jgi:PAP2 superfamily
VRRTPAGGLEAGEEREPGWVTGRAPGGVDWRMDWMPWKDALWLASALLAAGVLWRPAARWARTVTALFREAALVLGLYALWNWLGTQQLRHVEGAIAHGRTVWDVERAMGLPSEAWLQARFLGNDAVIRFSDQYYAWVHVPALMVFLVWLFLRHRDAYPTWRTSLALLTGICFVIQLVPVAPPRFYPELGFVDTAHMHGESVYDVLGIPGPSQVGAMPSVHVAWAVVIAWAALSVSRSRWRWIGLGHALMTVFVVVVTANHWWLDGIVALAILAALRAAVVPARAAARAVTGLVRRPAPASAPAPVLAASEAGEHAGP